MLQTIIRRDFGAGGGTEQNSYNLGDCNGLLVCSDVEPGATDYISVILKSSKHEQEVLVNRISLRALAAISDAEFGSSALLQSRLNAVTEGASLDFPFYAYYIPLGTLYLRANDAALDITLESAQAGASKWSVAAVFNHAGTDEIAKWIESRVLTDKAQDVDQVWIYNAAGTEILAPFSRDVSIQVGSSYGNTLCNLMDAAALTAALGQIESQGPQYCMKIFDSADRLQDAVQWNISGTEATDYRIITKIISRDSARVSRGVIQNLTRVQRALAVRSPESRQAIKRASIAPPLEEIEMAISRANVPGRSF